MKRLIMFFCIFTSMSFPSSFDSNSLKDWLEYSRALNRLDRQRQLTVNPQAVNSADSPNLSPSVILYKRPMHGLSRCCNDRGHHDFVNLSSTENVMLTQVDWVSKVSWVVTVYAAITKNSDMAQKAALTGVVLTTTSIVYKLWHKYNFDNC